jgi:hypothetical protein
MIVRVDNRSYRKIAQDNWGLTDEQMIGMHVHHRYPVSKGGTNDASNLYVCSPWFHAHVWHHPDTDHYHNWIASVCKPESRAKSWSTRKDNWSEVSKLGGIASVKAKQAKGITSWGHNINMTPKQMVERSSLGGKAVSAVLYICPECGIKCNAGNMTRHMKAKGHFGERIAC